jgi:hypothetical protein
MIFLLLERKENIHIIENLENIKYGLPKVGGTVLKVGISKMVIA